MVSENITKKQKHIPIRMCLGCSKRNDKKNFLRIVKNKGNILIDRTFKSPGRGAYICKSDDCLKRAVKSARLNRIFKMKIPDEIYKEIEAMLANE